MWPWGQTVTSLHPYWCDFKCCQDVKPPTNKLPVLLQIGVVVFSAKAKIVIKLNAYSNKNSLMERISKIKFKGGNKNMSCPLSLMRTTFFGKSRGARVGYPKIGIMITDGNETIDKKSLWEESKLIRHENILMMVICVGTTYNITVSDLCPQSISICLVCISKLMLWMASFASLINTACVRGNTEHPR